MNSFIAMLCKEGKIKAVEPSQEVSQSYLQKSEKALLSAKTLLPIGNHEDAIALTYYSMYYSALALLFRCGIKCENHTGTMLLLKELFSLDDKEIAKAKKDRIDHQYYADFRVSEQDVLAGIDSAQEYNALLRAFIAQLKNTDILAARKKVDLFTREQ